MKILCACVCVFMCVYVRERERERELLFKHPLGCCFGSISSPPRVGNGGWLAACPFPFLCPRWGEREKEEGEVERWKHQQKASSLFYLRFNASYQWGRGLAGSDGLT